MDLGAAIWVLGNEPLSEEPSPLHDSFILAAFSHFSVLPNATLLEYFYISIFLCAQEHCGSQAFPQTFNQAEIQSAFSAPRSSGK